MAQDLVFIRMYPNLGGKPKSREKNWEEKQICWRTSKLRRWWANVLKYCLKSAQILGFFNVKGRRNRRGLGSRGNQ